MRLPELGQSVFVVAGDRRVPAAVYELHGEDTVVVKHAEGGASLMVDLSELVAVEWTTHRGIFRGQGIVISLSGTTTPLAYIRLESSGVMQRRDYVRVEVVVDAELRQASGVPVEIKTIDLSGGGLRAYVPRDLVPDEPVDVTLLFPDMPSIGADAVVIRGDQASGYAFRFTVIDPKEHERLVKFVFEAHRRAFATVKRSA
jgi:PilZ domain-containing protein